MKGKGMKKQSNSSESTELRRLKLERLTLKALTPDQTRDIVYGAAASEPNERALTLRPMCYEW